MSINTYLNSESVGPLHERWILISMMKNWVDWTQVSKLNWLHKDQEAGRVDMDSSSQMEPILDQCAYRSEIRKITDSPWERRPFPPSKELLMEAFEEQKKQVKKQKNTTILKQREEVSQCFSDCRHRNPTFVNQSWKHERTPPPHSFSSFFSKRKTVKGKLCYDVFAVSKNNKKAELILIRSRTRD